MKVKDFIEVFKGCVDVTDNYTDELYIAYCGEKLTDAGAEHFKDALELEIESISTDIVVVRVSSKELSEEECERNLETARDLFYSMAGYCESKRWDEWFKDGDD